MAIAQSLCDFPIEETILADLVRVFDGKVKVRIYDDGGDEVYFDRFEYLVSWPEKNGHLLGRKVDFVDTEHDGTVQVWLE